MQALPKKLLPLTLIGIAVTSLFSVQPAQAYTVRLQQMGSNVVATGSGAINLTGLTLTFSGAGTNGIFASFGVIDTGVNGNQDLYIGFTGPTNFGSGGAFLPDTASGDLVGIQNYVGNVGLLVAMGYVSNAPLSDSSTYNSATFASLGVTPGIYVWTWGTGLAN